MLANYSMHYFGAAPVSADYYGRFAAALAQRIGAERAIRPFVGIMSQGTSGDQMWMDYGRPRNDPGIDATPTRSPSPPTRPTRRSPRTTTRFRWRWPRRRSTLRRRVPDDAAARVGPSHRRQDGGSALPADLPEVYAKEAIYLHEDPERELKLQAIRIGELGITAIPNEVFALTGLKIKAQSPLATTMNIELANGSEGYIPPPEQHALGGYTTWPARTAALEVQAEPKIVATVLGLLEQVAGKPRRDGPPEPAALRRARPGLPAAGLLAARRDGGTDGPRRHRPRARATLRGRRRLLLAGTGPGRA